MWLNLTKIINLKMEQNILANGKIIKDMDMECKFGLMVQNTKDNGFTTKLMEMVNFSM